jgi:hypothetical protein
MNSAKLKYLIGFAIVSRRLKPGVFASVKLDGRTQFGCQKEAGRDAPPDRTAFA